MANREADWDSREKPWSQLQTILVLLAYIPLATERISTTNPY